MINQFVGKYRFLSNFSPSTVKIGEYTYLNAEAAFQAQKDRNRQHEFILLDPSAAKRLGRRVVLRDDWEEVKDHMMYSVVVAKFEQNPELATKLIETGDVHLEEGNNWNDTYWGVSKGVGENMLGRILMMVRNYLKHQRALEKLLEEQKEDKEYKIIMDFFNEPDNN